MTAATDVVRRDDALDRTGVAVHDHELCGVAERRVDDRPFEAFAQGVRPVDSVLAFEVDVRRAARGFGLAARIRDRARAHEGAARTGRLARAELARRVDDDTDARGRYAELFRRDLLRDRVDALPHLGPAVPHLDGAIVVESDDRLRDLLEAVAQARVLQAESDADGLPAGARLVVVGFDRVEARACAEAPVVHHLARTPHRARRDHVAVADLPAAAADRGREPIEDAFHRELGLVRTEAAERAADGIVRAGRDRHDVDHRDVVRTARVARGPFQHLHPDRRVRAGVTDHAGTAAR